MSKLKNVFGMKNKKKADDSDEDSPSYTDPAVLHSTDPPSRNSKGISHPHYPPPRPCHGSNSPNPRRKNMDTAPVQGNRKPQNTENNRNSVPGLPTNEPSRAPPRINITKKVNKVSKFRTIPQYRLSNVHLRCVYETRAKNFKIFFKMARQISARSSVLSVSTQAW